MSLLPFGSPPPPTLIAGTNVTITTTGNTKTISVPGSVAAGAVTAWTSALSITPGAGFGTATTVDIYSRQVGDSLEVRGSFVCGTPTSTGISIVLPSGYVIDSTKLPSVQEQLGTLIRVNGGGLYSSSSVGPFILYWDGSTTNTVFGSYTPASQTTFSNTPVQTLFISGDTINFTFIVPIVGFSGGGAGSVTSVGFADTSTTPIFTVTGSPITGSGTIDNTLKTQSANTVFAGPSSGSAAQPTFRALTLADFPTTSGSSFLTSGTTYTTPSTITSSTLFKFQLVGGGGGGGGNSATRGYAGGGGSAGYGVVWLTGLAASTAYTIAIGAAGAAGTSTPSAGGNGGNTTLTVGATTYTASGGTGGIVGPQTNGIAGGAGGSTTNLTLAITGQNGGPTPPAVGSSIGSCGGSNPLGFGGASINDPPSGGSTGNAGTGYGSGGGGAVAGITTPAASAGGAGAQGCIIVEWSN